MMKKLSVGPTITVGDVQLIPVERISIETTAARDGIVALAAKEPVALIARRGSGRWAALDLEGKEIQLDLLLQQIGGLRERLEQI